MSSSLKSSYYARQKMPYLISHDCDTPMSGSASTWSDILLLHNLFSVCNTLFNVDLMFRSFYDLLKENPSRVHNIWEMNMALSEVVLSYFALLIMYIWVTMLCALSDTDSSLWPLEAYLWPNVWMCIFSEGIWVCDITWKWCERK